MDTWCTSNNENKGASQREQINCRLRTNCSTGQYSRFTFLVSMQCVFHGGHKRDKEGSSALRMDAVHPFETEEIFASTI
jgi:hypothetical protein